MSFPHQLSSHQLLCSSHGCINLWVTPFYRTVFIRSQPCQNLIYFSNPHTANRKNFSPDILLFLQPWKKYTLNFCICCGSCNSIGIFNLLIGWRETGQCSDWLRAWQLTSRIWSHVSWGDWWGEISISPLPARYYILQQSFIAKR